VEVHGHSSTAEPDDLRWPGTRATCAAILRVGFTPTMSSTSSAPYPRVISLMRVRAASLESSTSSAPMPLAISSLSAEVSTAMMVVPPAEHSQDLDGNLPKPAGPDHHGGRARAKHVE
jgi:hypothetical protein